MKKNKSIRILTFHSAYSYGAILQAYALYSFLIEHFTDVKIIDFRPIHFSIHAKLWRPKSWIISVLFSNFKKRMAYTKQYSADILRNNPPNADYYIIGSDQVWNPNITKDVKDIYYGDFIQDNQNKIAYAASCGKETFSQQEGSDFCKLIHGFKAISVREETGVLLCKKYLNLDVKCVLDPVFLLNDYYKRFKFSYIKKELCLFVLNNNTNTCFQCAKNIANKLNLKPKILNKNKWIKGFKIIPTPSIPRFLSEIHSSELVITNSFHGLAFSIIFEKNFLFVCTDPEKGTRAENILQKLGLRNRFFNSYKEAEDSGIWKETINYDIVNIKKDLLRKQSIEFLLSNLL